MTLSLTYVAQTEVPVEIEGLTPDWARGKPLAEIERFEIFHGNRRLPLAELFRVSGSADDGRMEFSGNLAGVHWLGAHMQSGELYLHGSVGRHVGSGMQGGELHVHGDVSDWVGCEMHGGLVHIHGSAGHHLGGAYPGSRKGMTGGMILVAGSAGDSAAHSLRRGIVAIGGEAGDMLGFNMIAGTVLVFGHCGQRPGAGMKRGTIGLFRNQPADLLPTFRFACRYRPQVMALLLQQLKKQAFAFDLALLNSDLDFYSGDFVSLGKGEIILQVS